MQSMKMTVEDCYLQIGEPYTEALHRFGSDARILKYLKMMQSDPSFDALCLAIERGDREASFRAAHTLKGIALNMSFTQLAQAAGELTEALRHPGSGNQVPSLLETTKQAYRNMLHSVNTLLAYSAEEG